MQWQVVFYSDENGNEPVKDFIVVIEMPLERTYVYNVEDILMAQIAGNKHDDPIFTPLGLEFVEHQLLSRIDKPVEWEA